MKCIYCLEEREGPHGSAHVVPEALAQNDMVLPQGAVCDPCNNYLGKLDLVLASHPMIALGIQWLKLPGKDGSVRAVVGNVEQADEEDAVHVPAAPPPPGFRGGDPEVRVRPLVPRTFDGFRFRRSLYHVAFNLLAHRDGPESVLSPEFNAVRRYVRMPKKNERWAFAQEPLLDSISPEVRLVLDHCDGALLVGLRLFAVLFWVDLHNTGSLRGYVAKQKNTPELKFVGPEDRLPREGPKQGETRYQLTIYRKG